MPQSIPHPIAVLFVCLGNICRSPTAEAVFRKKVTDIDMQDYIRIDSAGTAGYHKGAKPDTRSLEYGMEAGYDFTGISCRKLSEEDFELFDLIVVMDNKNVRDCQSVCPIEHQGKIVRLLEFAALPDDHFAEKEVPDPYYGGRKGFEVVLDLIEQGCDGLLKHLESGALAK